MKNLLRILIVLAVGLSLMVVGLTMGAHLSFNETNLFF